MKLKLISLILVLLILIVSAPVVFASSADDLVGTWERFGDAAEGTRVVVTKSDDFYQATLDTVTGTLIDLGFIKGDLKWKDISYQSDGTYSGFDLFRYGDSSGYEYRNSKLTIGDDGVLQISVANEAGTEVIIGTYQTWRKISTAIVPGKPSEWAVPEISKAIEYGLTTDKVLKNYQGNISREEFCEIAVKLYEALSLTKVEPIVPNPFIDTENPEILKAYKLGIVNGTSTTTFSPGNPATREQIAAMLLRTLQAAKPGIVIDTTGVEVFADQNDISNWALSAIQYFNKQSVINGIGSGKINPKGNTTREQAVAMVKRVYESNLN